MARLQTDGNYIAVTDNSGKPLLRTVGSIIQVAYGQTLVENTINSGLAFVPTSLSATIPVTSSTSQIIITAFTQKNFTAYTSSNLDFMVTGGAYNNTVISGASQGFSSANGGLDNGTEYIRGVSVNFVHSHGQNAGTSLTYTLAARGSFGVNGRNNLFKSTIVLMEVV